MSEYKILHILCISERVGALFGSLFLQIHYPLICNTMGTTIEKSKIYCGLNYIKIDIRIPNLIKSISHQ